MNQPEFLANTHNFLKVLQQCHMPGTIGFGFAPHWLKNWLLTVIWKLLYEPEWVQSRDLQYRSKVSYQSRRARIIEA